MTTTPLFFVCEVTAAKPGAATVTVAEGYGTAPHGALAELPDAISATGTLYASDMGYRSLSTDPQGVVAYPPLMAAGAQISVAVNLDPAQSGAAAAWGTVGLSNLTGQYDAIAASWNSDGRPVRILCGQKTYDTARGITIDPAYASLGAAFVGLATPWFLSDTELLIPLRDATYWLERQLQTTLYGGTGTYDGTSDLTGKPKPKARGGTGSFPIRNVTPTLIDPTNRIYQYNDGPGTVASLYEGGALTITFASDTTNLYVGTTPTGQYRTDNSRGLFQLGTTPVHAITADVTGQFPVAGVVTTAAMVARYLLTEDMSVPSANISTASFTAADTAFPYVAGLYFDSSAVVSGVDAITAALAGWGAKLVPFRDGTLRIFALRALPATAIPAATFSTLNAVSVTPRPLPSTLNPPPFRFRVGFQHNYTVQTSDLNTATATPDHVQFMASTDRFASAASGTVLAAYSRPNDPAPVTGSLLNFTDAHTVVNDFISLWAARRRLYDVVLPVGIAVAREIGDIVNITFPMDDLTGGQLGQIVGYQFRSVDATVTVTVLV